MQLDINLTRRNIEKKWNYVEVFFQSLILMSFKKKLSRLQTKDETFSKLILQSCANWGLYLEVKDCLYISSYKKKVSLDFNGNTSIIVVA